MPAVLLTLTLLLLGALGCTAETTSVPATQTVVRIEAEANVLAAMHSLRVRTAALQGNAWVLRNNKSFALDTLRWPVDIVLTPRVESEANRSFEAIAEALDADGRVLVQARALSGFVRREQRMLVLSLAACGESPLGSLCEQKDDCLGPSCLTCVAGACAQTPVIGADELISYEPISLDGARPDGVEEDGGERGGPEVDGGVQPGGDPERDSGDVLLDAGGMDAGMSDGAVPAAQMTDAAEPAPRCDPGSELTDAGACLDINECMRGLDDCDHTPQACVNGAPAFSCACPSGYRGTGKGDTGCADIDECMEKTDSCDDLAACNNTPGGYACGSCPSGYSPGTGGACVDINECLTNNGGCDTSPMASCNNQTGAANTCTCPAGYSGNGVGANGCTDNNECLTNNGGCDTSPMAGCNNQPGAANTCTCPNGYSGNGVGASGCADNNECLTNNGGCDTSPMATCNNPVGAANTCTCPSGYSGNGVGANGCVDPCNPNPCGAGLSCTRAAGGTASCVASCLSNGIGCQPGDTCVSDADCRVGGDSTDSCDATGKVCVEVCGATTITDPIHLTAARYCKEINGALVLNPTFATIAATDFPYLTRVRGAVTLGTAGGNAVLQSVTLNTVTTIDGALTGVFLTQLTRLSLPRVTNIAGGTTLSISDKLQQASFPQLRTVGGNWYWIGAPSLVQLDIGNLQTVTGMVSLQNLCKLPSSQITSIVGSGTPSLVNIGCCTSSLTAIGCNGGCSCN